jgi:hypothetical protein
MAKFYLADPCSEQNLGDIFVLVEGIKVHVLHPSFSKFPNLICGPGDSHLSPTIRIVSLGKSLGKSTWFSLAS